MPLVPTIYEKTSNYERNFDIFSLLLKERIIMLNGEIDDNMAQLIIAELLYLNSLDSSKEIYLYINSPGGSISSGLAIYDTMNLINNDVVTICVGMCASMGAFLLSSGTKGKRYALPNSEIMIHQPLGGAKGGCIDVEIFTNRLIKTKNRLHKILAINTNKTIEEINKATERDNFMDAKEALEFGLIDEIIYKK